jgi:glutathione peroxidase
MIEKLRGLAMLGAALFMSGVAMGGDGVSVLEHKVTDINGKEVELADYKGKVLLIVNVASKCGLTPQYEGLQAVYEKYKDKDLVVLGFPANNFGGQEPGTEVEILEFCTSKYDVTFDMFSKISVKGDDKHPLYKDLTDEEKNGEMGGEIGWNFTKFLVGKDGKVTARFEPRVKPTADEVTAAIEAELAKETA